MGLAITYFSIHEIPNFAMAGLDPHFIFFYMNVLIYVRFLLIKPSGEMLYGNNEHHRVKEKLIQHNRFRY